MLPMTATDTTWMRDAECGNNPSEWWTDTTITRGPLSWQTYENQLALHICNNCPVKRQCAEYVVSFESRASHKRWGIYAGTTPGQRDTLYLTATAQ